MCKNAQHILGCQDKEQHGMAPTLRPFIQPEGTLLKGREIPFLPTEEMTRGGIE